MKITIKKEDVEFIYEDGSKIDSYPTLVSCDKDNDRVLKVLEHITDQVIKLHAKQDN